MDKLKVMTIVGTRPEIIRLAEVIKAFDKYFNHILVHTGQNWDYELNQIFFKELELRKPDYYLDSAGKHLGETIGNIILKSYEVLSSEKPDALLILGDTNSALSAISAKRLKIPIFHMEAGNRCFDENLPEEINRRIVDHISDVNLPYTEHARRYLLAEGIRKEYIYVTGSPLTEILYKYKVNIENSNILNELSLEKNKYFIVSVHREENIDNEKFFLSIMSSINKIVETYKMPVVYSTHPRSKKFIIERKFEFHSLVKSLKPFGFFDYNKLQIDAYCTLSDSGTVLEEASILGFPAVSIRTSTERPEALDKGNVILGGVEQKDILQSIELAKAIWDSGSRPIPVTDYKDTNVSIKIIKIMQSYIKIVDKVIWRKV